MEFTPVSLKQRIVDLDLATSIQVEQAWAELRGDRSDLEEFKTVLLRKDLITNYQLDRLLTGERLGFFYGPYKVLYMIGAGTFAASFDASIARPSGLSP